MLLEQKDVQLFEQTTKSENELIWIKPLCDLFNLHVKNQYQKVKNDAILSNLVGKNRPDLGKIDENGRILLSKKGFLRWIQIINASTIDENLRDKFIMYQSNIIDYLFGSIEVKENTSAQYARLQKLRRLQGIINKEIKLCEKEVKNYVDAHLGVQGKLLLKS